jgi:TPR repeat protein
MVRVASLLALLVLLSAGTFAAGEPDWIEVKSPHFVVTSNAGERSARAVAWRFEQARSAIAAICPWAHVDLAKPTVVVAARDEATMKALVPSYWEERKSLHPDAVWFEGPNQYYVLLRADLRNESESDPTNPQNPYQMAYFAYIHVIVQASFPGTLPPWFSRGLSAVLSNTTVQEHAIFVGPPLVAHLNRLRERPPIPLKALLATTASDPGLRQQESQMTFDASAWAFMHFLLFADNAARRARVDSLARSLQLGGRPEAAVEESFGALQTLQLEYARYVSRSIFQYQKSTLDAAVKPEAFPVRRITPAEAVGLRATVHAVTQRPADAQRAIADARRLDAGVASSDLAEALLYDLSGDQPRARAAYEQAIAHGTDDAYAYYRCAVLNWPNDRNQETLKRLDTWLSTAIQRNSQYAAAYAALGQVRALTTQSEDTSVGLVLRAIALEPNMSETHRAAGATYLILGQLDKARGEAQTAARLAGTVDEGRAATTLLFQINDANAAERAEQARAREAAQAEEIRAKVTACQGGSPDACPSIIPFLQTRCGEKDAGACGMLGWLYQTGRGMATDVEQAAKWYRLSCEVGEQRGCIAFALMQSQGQGVARDVAAALELLDKGCTAAVAQACTQEAVLLASRQAPDKGRIRTLLDAGCKGGDQPACDMLTSMPAR